MDAERAKEFEHILGVIAAGLPVEALHVDVSANPDSVQPPSIAAEALEDIVSSMWGILQARGLSTIQIRDWMRSSEPFRNDWERTSKLIEDLERNFTDVA